MTLQLPAGLDSVANSDGWSAEERVSGADVVLLQVDGMKLLR